MQIKTRENIETKLLARPSPISYAKALMLIKTRENTEIQGKTVKPDHLARHRPYLLRLSLYTG